MQESKRQKSKPKRIMLAYSGGLDTSVILSYLKETYNAEVYAYLADLGQGEDLAAARKKAMSLGAADAIVDNLREEFVSQYVFAMMRANTLYEGDYLLGTAIARPLIAKGQVDAAYRHNCDALAHGATGRGNDQLRFEYGYAALAPELEVISPWRTWDLTSRERLLQYARDHQIAFTKDKLGEAPFSVDANLLHCSAEGKVLEDPEEIAPPHVYSLTQAPDSVTAKPLDLKIGFKAGDAVSIDRVKLSGEDLLTRLNEIGEKYGVGRLDMVETRSMGSKSRGVYECPGGTLLLIAHRAMEHLTLDGNALQLKNEIMPRYARLIYDGMWFSPERRMLQALIDESQKVVEGEVTLRVYSGHAQVVGRSSPIGLYRREQVTFDEGGELAQNAASDYITITSQRLKLDGTRQKRHTK